MNIITRMSRTQILLAIIDSFTDIFLPKSLLFKFGDFRMQFMHQISLLLLLQSMLCICADDSTSTAKVEGESDRLFVVEGKSIVRAELQPKANWQVGTRVFLDYGKFIGFVRQDGSFIIEDVPSGSYILEAASADYLFEPIRIDITNKGKIRARKLNLLQPNVVSTLPYPVQLNARQQMNYFRVREEWRVTDVLMNPMVIMLVVAFFLMVLMPKLAAQDPQMQKEMQNMQLPKVDMPDVADVLANIFGSSAGKKNARKAVGGVQNKKITR